MPTKRRLPVWFTAEEIRSIRENHKRFIKRERQFAKVTFPKFVRAMLQVSSPARRKP